MNLKARDWHNWVSVLLILPMLLVGFTSIFLAHKKELGINEIDLTPYVGWLPGYGASAMREMSPEIRSTATLADGSTLVGTQNGLFRADAAGVTAVAELAGDQVRDILPMTWGVIVAAKSGVWLEQDGRWQRVLKGDAWNASANLDGSVTVTLKERGPLSSPDGRFWSAPAVLVAGIASLPLEEIPPERVTLGKLMIDLHTGKAFLGKDGEWVWIDLLGFVWIFLGFTGLWLWWRTQTKKRDAAIKRAQTQPGIAHA
ncbi:hypothetical protein B4966_14010 [Rhodocyclaceae bacterium]|nr:hypothetical protein B4966_14010 [Rhodocyclaceae bacterium]